MRSPLMSILRSNKKLDRANRRCASALGTLQQFASTSPTPVYLSAAVARLWRQVTLDE